MIPEKDKTNPQEAETALYNLLKSLTLEQMKQPEPQLCGRLLSLYKTSNISPHPDFTSYKRWLADFWLKIEEQGTIGKSRNQDGESFYFDLGDFSTKIPKKTEGILPVFFIPPDFLSLPAEASYIRRRLINEGYHRELLAQQERIEDEYPPYEGEPFPETPEIPIKIMF